MKNRLALTALTAALTLMAVPFTAAGNPVTSENIESSVQSPALSADTAKEKAVAMLPAGSVLVHIENNKESYILKYYGAVSNELYSLKLSTDNGNLQKLETQAYLPLAASTAGANLKVAVIHKLVKDEIKEAKITNTELNIVDGKSLYIIRFQTPKLYGNYTFNAKNGFVEDRVIKAGVPFPHEETGNYIPWNELKNKALDTVPGGIVTDVNVKGLNGTVNYLVEVCKGSMVHNLVFNAFTGALLSESSDVDGWNDNHYQLVWQYKEYHPFHLLPETVAGRIIDTASAVAIAKHRAPQGELTNIKLYYENNTGIYEGKLEKGDLEYYFKVDAISGKLLYTGGDY